MDLELDIYKVFREADDLPPLHHQQAFYWDSKEFWA